MRHVPTTLLLLLVALLASGCGGAADPTGGGESPASEVASAASRLGAATLEDFGCGHGFTVGTPDQTVRLSLWSDSGESPQEGTHELGGSWTGQLVTGTNLFAQWCDDVIEPDEPEVVEDASWEVTGTLTWELVEGDGQCPSVATARMTDAEVLMADGAVSLPDVEFRNEFFGCFAG